MQVQTPTPQKPVTIKIKNRPGIAYIATVLIVAVLVGVGVHYFSTRSSTYTTHITEFNLKNVGKLVTQEGCYTSVQTLGDSRIIFGITIPFTERKYVYSLDGTVSAGIDFEKITIQPDSRAKTLTVALPQAEIFSVVPNEESFTVYHEGKNPFNDLHIEDMSASRIAMEAEIREKAIAYHILEHATENAKTLITTLLAQSFDLSEWRVNYTEAKGA